MPNLFLVFVIFMLVLIGLNCKNSSMSCILTYFQLINDLISAAVEDPDRIRLVLSRKFKASLQWLTTVQMRTFYSSMFTIY